MQAFNVRETREEKAEVKDTATFEMNGNAYETDTETLDVIRSIVSSAKEANDFSAVIAVMELGEATGRIRLIGKA